MNSSLWPMSCRLASKAPRNKEKEAGGQRRKGTRKQGKPLKGLNRSLYGSLVLSLPRGRHCEFNVCQNARSSERPQAQPFFASSGSSPRTVSGPGDRPHPRWQWQRASASCCLGSVASGVDLGLPWIEVQEGEKREHCVREEQLDSVWPVERPMEMARCRFIGIV